MNKRQFRRLREKFGKTQKQMAQLLGISPRAVHSYEQGWRCVPQHVERQLLLLASRKRASTVKLKPCWQVKGCPPERRRRCPAWEFQSGDLCWFINGTFCQGKALESWAEKIKLCRQCGVFQGLMER